MNNDLEKIDIEFIDFITEIAASIETLYIKLFNLEINGKKETEEYKKTIEYLKISVEVENELLQNKLLSSDKIIAMMFYLIKKKKSENFSENYKEVLNQSYNDRIFLRIFNKIYFKYKENPTILQSIEKYLDEPEEEILQNIIAKNELDKSLERDFLNSYLFLLQQFCLDSQDEYVFPYLLSTKYNLSYSIPSIEESLISLNFEIPDTLCLESSMIANIFSMNEEEYEKAKNDYGTKIAFSQIIKILDMDNKNFSNPKNIANSILKQCLLRAAFMFMDEETLQELNYQFHSQIENKKYLLKYPNNSVNENIVSKCFRKINSDKKRQHRLIIRKK